MIVALEREFGLLELDFDLDRHRDLHPHLRRRPHYPWEVIEHHLRNRAAFRRATTQRQPAHITGFQSRIVRSQVEALQSDLAVAFGAGTADLALAHAVFKAAAAVAAHITPASLFLERVVLSRYILSAPGASGARLDSFAAQLKALYFVLFERTDLTRSRAEMAVVNRLISKVILAEVVPEKGQRPALTLLMLAARAASGLTVDNADQDADDYVADFFARLVPVRRLQPFISPLQRAMLRQIALAPNPAIPLAALYRQQAGPGALPGPDLIEPAAFNAWFWETGVWRLALDYVLSTDMLTAQSAVQAPNAAIFADPVSYLPLRARPGTVLTFGPNSNGAVHCIGQDWRAKTAGHEWRGSGDLVIALRLAPEDAGPLDLFLDLQIPKGVGSERVKVTWNGRLVATTEIEDGRVQTHLGSQHRVGREANTLSVALDGEKTTPLKRPLRFMIRRLVLARR